MPEYKLGDIAFERTETCKDNKDAYPVVGLEHIVPEQIDLTEWDTKGENTFTKIFREGDILFGRRRAYLKKAAVAPFDGICSGDITVISAKGDKVCPSLLPFIIQNDALFEYAIKMSAGGLSPRVKWKDLQNFSVVLPDMDKQAELADLLWSMEHTRRAYRDLIAKTDELVKSQFVEMFGDPVLNPQRWRKEPLEKNATLLNGRAYKQEELLDKGKYPVLRVGNFFSNRGWYYSDLELEDDKYCDNGDLLYAWSASFGPQIWNGGKVIYHYHIWKVLVGEAYNKMFLCKLLEYVTSSLMGDTHGIAMMHLTKSGMEKTEFIVPPLAKQEEFCEFVSQVDKSKLSLQRSLEELTAMQKKIIEQNLT